MIASDGNWGSTSALRRINCSDLICFWLILVSSRRHLDEKLREQPYEMYQITYIICSGSSSEFEHFTEVPHVLQPLV